jgi:hypothetical protein
VVAPEDAAGFLQRFLQLEGIALNGEIEVADGEAAGEVADGASGEENGHAGVASCITNEAKGVLLGRRKAIFEKVIVVGHGAEVMLVVRLRSRPLCPDNRS